MITELLNQINYNIIHKVYDDDNKIYVSTNENLKRIFELFDIKDKKVLTVLSSSDQLLSCICKDAKEVDTFDRSYVTYFYYYLRKWLIQYKNSLYPSNKFLTDGDIELYNLIRSIIPTNDEEKKARTFWLKYLEINNYKGSKYLFESRYCKGIVPFDESIKEKLPNNITFYCMNFFDNIDIDKTYDIIILSNMLEYEKSKSKMEIIRKNLEKLLNYNGIAICSYKVTSKVSNFHISEIEEITKGKLVLDKEFSYYEPLLGTTCELAYSYRKKV